MMIEPPTAAEVEAAITGNMRNVLTVVKAVKKFKALLSKKRPPVMSSILGDSDNGRFSLPPSQMARVRGAAPGMDGRSQSMNLDDRQATETALVTEGVHRDLAGKFGSPEQLIKRKPIVSFNEQESDDDDDAALTRLQAAFQEHADPKKLPPFRASVSKSRSQDDSGRRGHAHDPLEDLLYLRIGPSTFAGQSTQEGYDDTFSLSDEYVVSESPGAADVDIYETAYRDEIERILARAKEQNKEPQVYLTRRVDEKLMQLSGLAGKLMAHGEGNYNSFRERKAQVAEVSRALREAAKEEYEKRRQERKAWIEQAKAEKAAKRSSPETPSTTTDHHSPAESSSSFPDTASPKPLESRDSWRTKAADKSRNAKSAFSGLVHQVKNRRS